MAQPQPHATEGFFGKGEDIHTAAEPVHTTTVHPKDLEASTGSENERSGASLHAIGTGNEVLESDAQSKGRWFQYIKTKQFWLTMLLGQGMVTLKSEPPTGSDTLLIVWFSSGYLHYQHQYALFSPCKRRLVMRQTLR